MCKELRGCSAGLSSQEGTSRPTALRLRWERFWGLEAALGFKHSSIGAGVRRGCVGLAAAGLQAASLHGLLEVLSWVPPAARCWTPQRAAKQRSPGFMPTGWHLQSSR